MPKVKVKKDTHRGRFFGAKVVSATLRNIPITRIYQVAPGLSDLLLVPSVILVALVH